MDGVNPLLPWQHLVLRMSWADDPTWASVAFRPYPSRIDAAILRWWCSGDLSLPVSHLCCDHFHDWKNLHCPSSPWAISYCFVLTSLLFSAVLSPPSPLLLPHYAAHYAMELMHHCISSSDQCCCPYFAMVLAMVQH